MKNVGLSTVNKNCWCVYKGETNVVKLEQKHTEPQKQTEINTKD